MEDLKNIKKCLVSQVQGQLGDLKKVNAKEMGEVIDMIKDLEEAMYYCEITKAMEKSQEEKEQGMNVNYYMESPMYYCDRSSSSTTTSGNVRPYVPYMEYAPYMMRDKQWRDERFGDKSGMSRRMYMEGKHSHGDQQQSMKELEYYIKDLGDDLTDMIKESSPEEKQVLSTKLQQLATKINTNK